VKVTPSDIRQRQFKKVFKGFEPTEVAGFLKFIAGEYEILLSQNASLTENLAKVERELSDIKVKMILGPGGGPPGGAALFDLLVYLSTG